MAQLRDAHTSELVAEGDPLALVHVARELGKRAVVAQAGEELPDDAELLYDDVGVGFNPDAVLEANADNLDGLREVARSEEDDRVRDTAEQNVRRIEGTIAAAREAAGGVDRVVESARDSERATLDPVTLPPPE